LAKVEKPLITCLTAILILIMSFSYEPVLAQTNGPREEDLIIKFYSNIEQAYSALKDGSIDIIGYELTLDLYLDAINDSNIVLAPVGDKRMYEFDINNNYTATDLNDGRRSPTNYLDFRKGIAYCVDKDLVVDTFCGGFADRIDQPMAYMHRGWRNQSYWYEDGTYPYECNLVQASAAFDAAGFVQGSDPNPDYDAGVPGSVPNLRIHPDKGTTMNLLEVCCRSDDARRLEAGRALCDALRLVGVPVNQIEADSSVLYPKILDNFDYNVYTGGWSLGRFPGVSAFGLYHSSQYGSGQLNYVTGVGQNGDPNYPKLDELLEVARFPDNHTEAVSTTKNAMGYFTEECITIPLFSAKSFWAWSSDLLGVVNSDRFSPVNDYSLMNAYKVDGSSIRVGLKTPPNAMNKYFSMWYYDFQCLDRMNLYTGLDVPPYDLSIDQAGYILNWTTSTYIDPDDSMEKTVITQTYRDDAWFVEPVTGNQLEQINATHLYASIWLEMQYGRWTYRTMNIKTLRMKSPYTIEIYWRDRSYWNTYMSVSLSSFNWLRKGTLSQMITEPLTADAVTGFVSCTAPVFYVLSAESDGSPLAVGVDYDIYTTTDLKYPYVDVRIINEEYLGANINITYLAVDDAFGYFPGGLPWQDAFEGAGMYYAVDFVPDFGGHLALKRNPFFFMETPPLGEINFHKKPDGCYKVDIFDVVMAVSAYGSQGISVPDAHWVPGADLAYPGGQIDIFDIITIASKYGTEWDCP